MAQDLDLETASTYTSYVALGFGATAVALPRLFNAIFGLGGDPRTRILTRLWGTRTAVLGGALLTSDRDEERRRLIGMATAMNALDAVLEATSGPEVARRGRLLGPLISGGLAALGGYVLASNR